MVDAAGIRINVDRIKAASRASPNSDVANSLLISLSGSGQIAPNQWLNWGNGVNYQVMVQTPQYKIDFVDALMRTPISPPPRRWSEHYPGPWPAPLMQATHPSVRRPTGLRSLRKSGIVPYQQRSFFRTSPPSITACPPMIVNHYNVQPVFDVYANVDRRDLGSVASAVEKIMQRRKSANATSSIVMLRGQAATMQTSFYRLGLGLIAAIVLVYLLMAVNFQSWVDPFIILTALPGALAGILWMLFVTQTTFSVPSLMGAIMCIGVATANSILMVVFANDERMEGKGVRAAALSAGFTRLRPVLMTARL